MKAGSPALNRRLRSELEVELLLALEYCFPRLRAGSATDTDELNKIAAVIKKARSTQS